MFSAAIDVGASDSKAGHCSNQFSSGVQAHIFMFYELFYAVCQVDMNDLCVLLIVLQCPSLWLTRFQNNL